MLDFAPNLCVLRVFVVKFVFAGVQVHTQFDVLTAAAAWNQLRAGLRGENLQLWAEDFKVFWASPVTNPTHISRLSNILLTFQLPILYNAG